MHIRLVSMLLLVFAALSAPVTAHAAVAPARPDLVPACSEQGTTEAAPSGPVCVVAGTVYCSEYGSRYREPLRLVLVDERGRHESAISDTNGSFAVPIPCSGSFEVRIEFEGHGMAVGRIEMPLSAEGTVFTLELRHTGSYLELVRDIREGVEEDDVTYRLVVPE